MSRRLVTLGSGVGTLAILLVAFWNPPWDSLTLPAGTHAINFSLVDANGPPSGDAGHIQAFSDPGFIFGLALAATFPGSPTKMSLRANALCPPTPTGQPYTPAGPNSPCWPNLPLPFEDPATTLYLAVATDNGCATHHEALALAGHTLVWQFA